MTTTQSQTSNQSRQLELDAYELLLEELATDRGLGWSEIARLCEVSVSAVRKWSNCLTVAHRTGAPLPARNGRSLNFPTVNEP